MPKAISENAEPLGDSPPKEVKALKTLGSCTRMATKGAANRTSHMTCVQSWNFASSVMPNMTSGMIPTAAMR